MILAAVTYTDFTILQHRRISLSCSTELSQVLSCQCQSGCDACCRVLASGALLLHLLPVARTQPLAHSTWSTQHAAHSSYTTLHLIDDLSLLHQRTSLDAILDAAYS